MGATAITEGTQQPPAGSEQPLHWQKGWTGQDKLQKMGLDGPDSFIPFSFPTLTWIITNFHVPLASDPCSLLQGRAKDSLPSAHPSPASLAGRHIISDSKDVIAQNIQVAAHRKGEQFLFWEG